MSKQRCSHRESTRRQIAVEEVVDHRRHDIELVLQREMARIEKMKIGVRQIPEIRSGAISGEYLVILTPYDQRRRFTLVKEGLELGIKRNVAAVIVEQIQLNVLVAGPVQQHLVVQPVVRVDARQIADTIGVLELRRGGKHKKA